MSAVYFDERAFADKVMARVFAEPTPSVTGVAVTALRQLSPRLLFGVSWTAWHLVTTGTAAVRPQVRLKSAALLSVVLMTLAMGTTFAAAGAVAVVQQVAQNFPVLTSPHHPNPSQSSSHGGGTPVASHEPGDKRADPSAVPAGAQPPAGAGEPHASASPGDDGGGRSGGGGDGTGQGDGNVGGGKGAHPSQTPGDDGQGGDNGGGGDQGDGHGSQTSPSPTDDGQGDNQGGGENSDGGDNSNGANGSDHSTGGQDSGNGSIGSGENNGNNGTNGHD